MVSIGGGSLSARPPRAYPASGASLARAPFAERKGLVVGGGVGSWLVVGVVREPPLRVAGMLGFGWWERLLFFGYFPSLVGAARFQTRGSRSEPPLIPP